MSLSSFQQDLKEGMSIHDALQKHNLTFKQAVQGVSKPITKPKVKPNNIKKYILEVNGKYTLRKSINGKTRMFGTYKSLDDALRMRHHCMKNGWKQQSIDEYCQELGIERSKGHPNCKVRYH